MGIPSSMAKEYHNGILTRLDIAIMYVYSLLTTIDRGTESPVTTIRLTIVQDRVFFRGELASITPE
jgi:hypothetical protein